MGEQCGEIGRWVMRDRTDPDTLSQPLFSVHLLSSCSRDSFHLCHAQNAITPLATPTTKNGPVLLQNTHMSCTGCTIQHNCLPSGATIVRHFNGFIQRWFMLWILWLNCLGGDPLNGCSWLNSRPQTRFPLSISHLCIHLFIFLNGSNRYFPSRLSFNHLRDFAGYKRVMMTTLGWRLNPFQWDKQSDVRAHTHTHTHTHTHGWQWKQFITTQAVATCDCSRYYSSKGKSMQ